jgi:hypothetical protein
VKPADLHIYDVYPTLINNLVSAARQADTLPLEDMLTALDRIALTSVYRHPRGSLPITPAAVDQQRKLIEAVITFRDAVKATVRGPAGGTG